MPGHSVGLGGLRPFGTFWTISLTEYLKLLIFLIFVNPTQDMVEFLFLKSIDIWEIIELFKTSLTSHITIPKEKTSDFGVVSPLWINSGAAL